MPAMTKQNNIQKDYRSMLHWLASPQLQERQECMGVEKGKIAREWARCIF
jgi:hypothetical protein